MNGVSNGYHCCRLQLSATMIEYPMTVRPNKALERPVKCCGRIVLALDCVPWRRRPAAQLGR